MRRHLGTLLKVGITLFGLVYVLLRFDAGAVADVVVGVDWGWLAVALLLLVLGLAVRAYRWLLLLRGLGVPVSLRRLTTIYFVGNFFNAFLPSGFGGDVMRVVEAARDVPVAVATGTVIVDRLTGLLMLFVMALLALPFRPPGFPPLWLWAIAGVSAAGLGAGAVLLDGRLIRRFGGWLPGKLSPVGDGPIAQVLAAVQGSGWPAVRGALLVSLIFNLMLVGWWAATGQALGLPLTLSHYLLAAPIMSIALLLPSISGLGVREALAPSLFAIGGVTPEEAISLTFLVFVVTRVSSLMGGPVYLASLWGQRRDEDARAGSQP